MPPTPTMLCEPPLVRPPRLPGALLRSASSAVPPPKRLATDQTGGGTTKATGGTQLLLPPSSLEAMEDRAQGGEAAGPAPPRDERPWWKAESDDVWYW